VPASFQEARYFTATTADRYSRLGARYPLVAALGVDLDLTPTPGVRVVPLAHDDLLRGEWVVAVVGDHCAGALIAHDLGDSGPDRSRRFGFALSHHHRPAGRA
jgi:DICT domain-containing protein